MRQPKCSEVAVYHAHIFCSVKGGTEIILSVPLASKLSAQEQEKHSQILSLSLSSHLGNGNLYLQTVGAGGEHEIFKSTSLHSPPPSLPGLHALSLPTPPLTLFISEMHCKAACQWCIPCFVSLTSQWWDAAELLILHASSSVHCFHSSPWHDSWPVVTWGWETPVFLDLDPHAFSNKIRLYTWGRGWGEEH